MIFKSALLSSLCFTVYIPTAVAADVKPTQVAQETRWPLTGQEILLEVFDPRSELSPGIYAVDPKELLTNNHVPLKLLVKNAQRPRWSRHHKRISYEFNGKLYICDLQGNRSPLFSSLPVDGETKINWQQNGKLTVSYSIPSRGTQTYVMGFDVENAPVKELRSFGEDSFSTNFTALLPYAKPLYGAATAENTKWENILTCRNISFSPEGTSFVADVYPLSPFNLKQKESRIQIFRWKEWTKDSKEISTRAKENSALYVSEAVVLPLDGAGRNLNTNKENGISELNPTWSPDGSWIAYDKVNFSTEVVTPVVREAKGEAAFELVARGEVPSQWTLSDEVAKGFDNLTKNTEIWGNTNYRLCQWSATPDTNYIWMESNSFDLAVAKPRGGKWLIRKVDIVNSSEVGIAFKGFRGSQVVWLQDSGDIRRISVLTLSDVETGVEKSDSLRAGLEVRSLCW